MDMSKLLKEEVLQLPDECFGRRWPIFFTGICTSGGSTFDISEMALPDRCVLWELQFASGNTTYGHDSFGRLAVYLGDHLPANDAELSVMEPVFGPQGDFQAGVWYQNVHMYTRYTCRLPLAAQGRRFVIKLRDLSEAVHFFNLTLVVSSIPKYIPQHLLHPQTETIIELLKSIKKWSLK